jgi:branched-chain amino acid transport system substrate-binding protein
MQRAWAICALLIVCLSGAQSAAAVEPVRVGMTVSLTGPYAELGKMELEGAQMWVDDLNGRGALLGRPVKLVYYDDESDPATSAALYEKLIVQDGVDLLLGPYASDITMAASSVAERHGFPMVATGAASKEIWARGYKNIFQIDAPAGTYMDLPLEYASEQGLKRVALVYGESAFPSEVADGVRAKTSSLGMVLVLDEVYLADTTDFSDLVQRVGSVNPDIVVGGTYLEDSVALVREMKRANVSPRMIVLTVGPALREFGDALGDAANGVMGVVAWMRSGRIPMAYDFSFRYKQKYGSNAAAHAAYGYGGGQVLEAAVRLANTLDKAKLREQLRTLKFQSILGNYRVNEQGLQTAKRTGVMQWHNGFRLLVLPKPNADGPVDFPFKPWSDR